MTNLSVNPARSTGPALFAGGWALTQLWLFWVIPLAGGALAGLVYPMIFGEKKEAPAVPAKTIRRQPEPLPAE